MSPLDRMEIEEAGPNPERLAAAIHAQLGHKCGPVPVSEIAGALDILDIREHPLVGLEGALVTTSDRNTGAIVVNSQSSPERRRFTLAHELGHFLNLWHEPKHPSGGFSCSRSELRLGWRKGSTSTPRHGVQEFQANRFAIGLLAPFRLVRPLLYGLPDLEKVLKLAERLEISREAAARRYVELHDRPAALVFSAAGVVRYVERQREFPFVSCGRGERLLDFSDPCDTAGVSAYVEVDARDWLIRSAGIPLVAQTLRQSGGYSMTLLVIDDSDEDLQE